jgi:hypothetical protein
MLGRFFKWILILAVISKAANFLSTVDPLTSSNSTLLIAIVLYVCFYVAVGYGIYRAIRWLISLFRTPKKIFYVVEEGRRFKITWDQKTGEIRSDLVGYVPPEA